MKGRASEQDMYEALIRLDSAFRPGERRMFVFPISATGSVHSLPSISQTEVFFDGPAAIVVGRGKQAKS